MEVEAKFRLEAPVAPEQLDGLRLGRYVTMRADEHDLRDVLLDTATGDLERAKIALRIRQDGPTKLITLKGPAATDEAGIFRREEIELPLTAANPLEPADWPPPIADRYRTVAGDAPPRVQCLVRNLRRTWDVRRVAELRGPGDSTGLVAELALDEGIFLVDGRSRPFHELEIELKGTGGEDDLRRIIDWLRAMLPLRPEPRSKSERARAFAREVRDEEPVGAASAPTAPLADSLTEAEDTAAVSAGPSDDVDVIAAAVSAGLPAQPDVQAETMPERAPEPAVVAAEPARSYVWTTPLAPVDTPAVAWRDEPTAGSVQAATAPGGSAAGTPVGTGSTPVGDGSAAPAPVAAGAVAAVEVSLHGAAAELAGAGPDRPGDEHAVAGAEATVDTAPSPAPILPLSTEAPADETEDTGLIEEEILLEDDAGDEPSASPEAEAAATEPPAASAGAPTMPAPSEPASEAAPALVAAPPAQPELVSLVQPSAAVETGAPPAAAPAAAAPAPDVAAAAGEAGEGGPASDDADMAVAMVLEAPLAEAGRTYLRRQMAILREWESVARAGEDPEGVHKMRVATRRLRAGLAVLETTVYDPAVARRYRRGLRSLSRAVAEVRDADVLLDHLTAHRATLPEGEAAALAGLDENVRAHREQARGDMLVALDDRRTRRLLDDLERFLRTPGEGSRAPGADPAVIEPTLVRHFAGSAIWQAYERVLAYGVAMPAPIETLHRLRIAGKQLRYTLEFFQPALPADEARAARQLIVAMQDQLGLLQDDEVALTAIDRAIAARARHSEDLSRRYRIVATEPVEAPSARGHGKPADRRSDRPRRAPAEIVVLLPALATDESGSDPVFHALIDYRRRRLDHLDAGAASFPTEIWPSLSDRPFRDRLARLIAAL